MKHYLAWGILLLSMIVLAVLLVYLYTVKSIDSISDLVQVFLTGCLVLITAYYAWSTAIISRNSEESSQDIKSQAEAAIQLARETQELKLDSNRPILIPVEGWNGVANISPGVVYFDPRRLLRLRNIGSGPALNITTRLEKRSIDTISVKAINESVTATIPIAPGSEELVRHWHEHDNEGKIEDDDWIVINYSDMFNRKFRTEAKYAKLQDTNIWINLK